jgi:outer membrane receptor protein involved in Fe transport
MTRWQPHLAIWSVLILCLTGPSSFLKSPAFSQVTDPDQTQTTEPIVLPTEVISATRYERPLAELPLSATVITREDILNSPGRSIDDSLRNVAGIQLNLDSADVIFPIIPSIAMRGIGVGDTATRSLVLVDGIPINGGFFGNVFWNRVPKPVIDRVEVVRGASSSLFGSYAMGGVVNIVTAAASKTEGSTEALYGQNNRFQGNFNYGYVLNENASLSFNGDYYDTNGFYRVPSSQIQPVDERLHGSSYNAQGQANLTFSNSVKGFLRAGYNKQRQLGEFVNERRNTEIPDIAGGLNIDLNGHGQLGVNAFYAHEHFRIDNVEVVNPISSFVSNAHRTTSDDYGFSLQWSKGYGGPFSRLSAGLDFRRIDGKDDQDVFNSPNSLDAIVLGAGKQTSVGIFAEASLKPWEKVEILGGLRYDYFGNSDGRIVTNGITQDFADKNFNIVSPRVAARYQFIEPLAFRTAFYGGFRAPALSQLYRSFESPTFRGLPNPNLKEERLWGGDVGLDLQLGKFSGQFNGFYNRVKNFVGSEDVGFINGKFTVMASNVAEIKSRGIELIGNWRLTEELALSLYYTYTNAEVSKGPLKGNQNEGAPQNMAGFSVNYRFPFGLYMNARGRYVDHSFQDISNTAPQSAHFIFDLLASYPVYKNLEVLFTAENLFDKQYVSDGFGQVLGAPQQISGGFRFRF